MIQSQPEPDSQNLVKRIAQNIIQYAPLGGNVFILGSFAWSRSVLEASITAFLLIPTTIWAKFSEGFIEEFGVASNRWGKDTGKALTQAFELSVLQRLAKLEDKYIRAQGMKCADLEVDGFQFSDLDCVPLLEQVFVPLKLHQNSFIDASGKKRLNSPGYGGPSAKFDPNRIYSIWEFLQKSHQENLAIKAYGGYGKTTLLRHVAYAFMSGEYKRQKGYRVPKRLPVLIYLRNAQTVLGNADTADLPAFLHSYHLPSLSRRQDLQARFSVDWIELQLRRGKMLVMFDGFDEVKKDQRQQVSHWIGEQMQEYPASVFIVTSRPKAYNQDFVVKQQCTFTVAVDKFSSEQQREFINNWYRSQEIKVRRGRKTDNVLDLAQTNADNLWGQLKARPELQALAENPLMLNIMVTVHRSQKGQQLPDRKAQLYQQIFNLQLGTRILERGLPLMMPAASSQKVLQGVAFDMFSMPNVTQVTKESLIELLRKNLSLADDLDELDTFNVEMWLFQLENRSELIVRRDEFYEFSHKSFQEFLAAKYIKEYEKEDELLRSWQWDTEWEGTVSLYSTLVNPSKLIKKLFDFGTERGRLLASRCLDSTPRKVEESVKNKLIKLDKIKQDLRYKKLRRLLQEERWEQANQETYLLMKEIKDKDRKEELYESDIFDFPKIDLQEINNLWLQYSKGKFGFTVQYKIWKQNKSPKFYDKSYEVFGEKLGWYIDGWVAESSLVYNLEKSKPGHLPDIRNTWIGLNLFIFLRLEKINQPTTYQIQASNMHISGDFHQNFWGGGDNIADSDL